MGTPARGRSLPRRSARLARALVARVGLSGASGAGLPRMLWARRAITTVIKVRRRRRLADSLSLSLSACSGAAPCHSIIRVSGRSRPRSAATPAASGSGCARKRRRAFRRLLVVHNRLCMWFYACMSIPTHVKMRRTSRRRRRLRAQALFSRGRGSEARMVREEARRSRSSILDSEFSTCRVTASIATL